MALSDAQKLYAMYVIGEVESHWNWGSVNYNDPITLGMMQWCGTRAAALLNRCKNEDAEGYALLADTLRASVDAHAATDSWWTTRYVTRTEGNSWTTAAQRSQIHQIQQNQFVQDDVPAYVRVLTSWGLAEDNVKTLIFAMSMYHQSPRQCGRVVATVGNSDLDTIWRACLNDGILGQYTNRYNTVHARLKAWDGTSDPPDFGQSSDPDTKPGGDAGGSGGTITQQSGVYRIERNGGNLILFNKEFPNGLVCVRANGGNWYPVANSSGAPDAPNQGGDDTPSAPSSDFTKMFKLWQDNANKWSYGQGAGRLNPPSSGYSDCSACIWWAINSIRPDLAKNIGTWTGAMVNSGTEIARGGPTTAWPSDKVQPGDILLIEWGYTNWAFNDGSSHVEWITDKDHLWGAGAAPLPHDSGSASAYIRNTGCWMIRRII